jgi:hypothetical protein
MVRRRLLDSEGITVPGGVVLVDPYRGMPGALFWFKTCVSVFWRS